MNSVLYQCSNVPMTDDLQFYILFNSTSVISGQWEGDNEKLSATEPCLQLKRFLPPAGLELLTA